MYAGGAYNPITWLVIEFKTNPHGFFIKYQGFFAWGRVSHDPYLFLRLLGPLLLSTCFMPENMAGAY